ncbi:hypothetical protein J27TS7_23770 [Paenibacillus dendritiformis]|uniref:hypothetical protein n=1 Tax=Paenibacillus dendritiformis TaxID=130049 RepID=UPI001B12EEE9|nr:hypothetical protein [Paenibacillus dendritiformis]GIO72863.1 hypothetical protein J27TS7_23770 [Paenibacillus dendritiformis]
MKKSVLAILLAAIATLSPTAPVSAATTYTNQDFTAYLGPAGVSKPVFASGASAYIGGVAVHPSSWGSSNWNKPIYPFGTMLVLTGNNRIVTPDGSSLNTFIVEDTGDLNNTKGLSYRWVDVYFGKYSTANYSAAIQFGKKKFSYTVID